VASERGSRSKDQVVSGVDYRSNNTTEWVSFTSDPVWSQSSPNSPAASTPSIKLAPRFEREERADIQDKSDKDCGNTKNSNNHLLMPRLGPDFKDQVHERRSPTRSPVWVNHRQGPTFKNQVQEAPPSSEAEQKADVAPRCRTPLRSSDLQIPVSPGAQAVQLHGNRSLSAHTTVDSAEVRDMDADDNDEESHREVPSLINAVLVNSKAIPQAEEVKLVNSMRKRCLLTVLILVLVAAGIVAGVCGDGSCTHTSGVENRDLPTPESTVDLASFPCGLDIETLRHYFPYLCLAT